jgi:hypothetical protein
MCTCQRNCAPVSLFDVNYAGFVSDLTFSYFPLCSMSGVICFLGAANFLGCALPCEPQRDNSLGNYLPHTELVLGRGKAVCSYKAREAVLVKSTPNKNLDG